MKKSLGSKREDRFSDHFSDLVQNICSVRFSYLLRLSISRVLRERRVWFPTSDRLETLLIPSGTTRSRQFHESTMVWGNLPLYHLCKCLLTLCHNLFVRKDKTKYQKRWYGGKLRQTMVDSWYCLDRVVPEGISQVSKRSEVGNIKRRSLNNQLSSGTSAGTFAVSAGPYQSRYEKRTLTCFWYHFKKRVGNSIITFRT